MELHFEIKIRSDMFKKPVALAIFFGIITQSCSLSIPGNPTLIQNATNTPTPILTPTIAVSPTPEPTATESGPVTINWYVGLGSGAASTTGYSNKNETDAETAFVDKFNRENGERYKLVIQIAGSDFGLNPMIGTDKAPDIVGPIHPYYQSKLAEYWVDVSDLAKRTGFELSGFDARVIDDYTWGSSGLVAIPMLEYPSALFYNKNAFLQTHTPFPPHTWGADYNGKPWDYEALRTLAMKFTHDELGRGSTMPGFDPGQTLFYGFHATFADIVDQWSFLGAGELLDDQGKVALPDVWRKAAHWYYDGLWKYHFIPTSADISNRKKFNSTNTFEGGNVAMAPAYSSYLCCAEDNITRYRFTWDVAALPSFNGSGPNAPLWAEGFSIPKKSRHPQQAMEVIRLLTTKYASELLEIYTQGALYAFPAYKGLQNDYLAKAQSKYPDVDCQVFLDSMNSTGMVVRFMPKKNWDGFYSTLDAFQKKFESTDNLDLDRELDQLQIDLQSTVS
jgi:multiple sugar transport system substrate-binding protein